MYLTLFSDNFLEDMEADAYAKVSRLVFWMNKRFLFHDKQQSILMWLLILSLPTMQY